MIPEKIKELLAEPYWQLDQIFEIAVYYKFPNGGAVSCETTKEHIELFENIITACKTGKVTAIDYVKECKGPERIKTWVERSSYFTLLMYVYGNIMLFAVLLSLIASVTNWRINVWEASVLMTFFPLIGASGTAFIMTNLYPKILLMISKSPTDKFRVLQEFAPIRLASQNIFLAETAINYLNERLRLNIPHEPFRVWKQPFFKRNGEYWIAGYMGKIVCLSDRVILEKIAYLLNEPYKEFNCLEFIKPDATREDNNKPLKNEGSIETEDDGYKPFMGKMNQLKISKDKAQENLKEYMNFKDAALAEGDSDDAINWQNKIDFMNRYIQNTFERSGSEKPPRGDVDRAKDATKKGIDRLIKELRLQHPVLSDHLKNYITKSYTVCYRPPDAIMWDVRF